jgi:hypothetical protein
MLPYSANVAANLVREFAFPTDTKILFVGAGFGWTIEILENSFNYVNILGTDTSQYILDNQDSNEDAEIAEAMAKVGLDASRGEGLRKRANIRTAGKRRRCAKPIENEDLLSVASRNRVKTKLGGSVDVAITEEVLTCLEDAEAATLSASMNTLAPQVIHLTTELQEAGQDSEYNWKSIDDWKALLPADTIASLNTWRVV